MSIWFGNDIWSEMDDLGRQLANLEERDGRRPAGGNGNGRHVGRESYADWHPMADLVETDQDYRIVMDLPGVRKEDIKVDLRDGVLAIEGKKEEPEIPADQHAKVMRRERRMGKFVRSFGVPSGCCSPENVSASFENGVLRVSITKPKPQQPVVININ